MATLSESRSWFRKLALPVRIASIVVVTFLVAGAALWIYIDRNRCSPGVERVDGQCIGVTDGSVTLSPDLADVLHKIQEENEWVDSSGSDAVSVAYLLALPPPSSDATREVTLRHELEGAHLAQRQANRTKTLGDKPLLRLLVANDGNGSTQWQKVVPALVDKVDGPDRLVAVVATGQTVTARQAAIGELIAQGIPVIPSRLTGDGLLLPTDHPSPVQGLARPAPLNSDQAAAAAAYLKPSAARALLVHSDDPDDTYSKSLRDAFLGTFPDDTHTVLEPAETYNPKLGNVASRMRNILVNICYQEPDVVFFAGRGAELEDFVTALSKRPCPKLPINIMTGDSAVHLGTSLRSNTELRNGLNTNASLRYTALAHPASWEKSPDSFLPASREPFQGSCNNCYRSLFPDSPLDDGAAIMAYDAVVLAVTAIRPDNDRPTFIIQEFKGMHGPQAVSGASGWISLGENGKPINKAVPILEVKPDGAVEFVKLSAPRGEPCRPDVRELC